MVKNWYNQIPYAALKTKRELTRYINWQQFTRRSNPNEQLFPRQVVIQLSKFVTQIIGEPKYGQQEQVTVKNHNRSAALERSVLKYWGWVVRRGLNRFCGLQTSPSASAMAQNI